MKEIPLTQGKVALVDDEDYERLNKFKWHVHTCANAVYAVRAVNYPKGKEYMHRVIMDCPKELQIDHIDGFCLDNRKSNLRIVTNRQNQQNRHHKKTSEYPGVYWEKARGKWRALIRIDGIQKHLGYFKTEFGAYRAYVQECNSLGRPVIKKEGVVS